MGIRTTGTKWLLGLEGPSGYQNNGTKWLDKDDQVAIRTIGTRWL